MKLFCTFKGMLCIAIQLIIIAGCSKKVSMPSVTTKTPGLQLVIDNLISPVAIAEPPDLTAHIDYLLWTNWDRSGSSEPMV
jgi:hypothetical protein